MNTRLKHNFMVAPIVLLVRVPLMLPLLALTIVGEMAERAGDWLSDRLPAFKSG